jgi:hypothetical protein
MNHCHILYFLTSNNFWKSWHNSNEVADSLIWNTSYKVQYMFYICKTIMITYPFFVANRISCVDHSKDSKLICGFQYKSCLTNVDIIHFVITEKLLYSTKVSPSSSRCFLYSFCLFWLCVGSGHPLSFLLIEF